MKDYVLAGSSSINGCGNLFVSVFQNAYAKASRDCLLVDVLREIREGKYSKQITAIRETYRRVLDQTKSVKAAKKAIDTAKKQLPAFCMSGTAAGRKNPLKHSGLLQIDLDALGEALRALLKKLKNDPHVAFGFVSPSGDGLKLGLRIDGGRHSESFEAAKAYFKNRYKREIDTACKDRLRLCFVSHDPGLWINGDATPLPIKTDTTQDIRLNPASASSSCVLHPATASYITPAVMLSLIKDRHEKIAYLEAKRLGLSQLFELLVESRFEPVVGGRNDFIVQSVPFLYRAVSPPIALEFIGCYYDCHRALFNDPRDTHMKEAAFMLDSVKKTYADSLTEDERQIYFALKEDQQTVFRICRDLAHLPEPKREPLTFYLSFNQLGLRIGVYDMQAQRIMRQLQHFGLVGLIEKGTRRALGVRGKAGTYKWLLSYPNGGNQNHE